MRAFGSDCCRVEHTTFGSSHHVVCIAGDWTLEDGPGRRGESGGGYSCAAHVGPDWRALAGTVLLISGCCIGYVAHCSQSSQRSLVVAVLAAISLYFLLRCAFTDPGVIPPQAPPEVAPPMIIKEVSELRSGASVAVERRWCIVCNLYRPLRAVHCRFCNVCIMRRDHHCPWTGTCVGIRNYRFYFGFIVSTLVAAVVVVVCSVQDFYGWYSFWRASAESASTLDGVGHGLNRMGVLGVSILLVSLLATVMLLNLTWFHWYLIRHDATTSEESKGGPYAQHPFSTGNSWLNLVNVLSAREPSLLGSSGHDKAVELLSVKPQTPDDADAPPNPPSAQHTPCSASEPHTPRNASEPHTPCDPLPETLSRASPSSGAGIVASSPSDAPRGGL